MTEAMVPNTLARGLLEAVGQVLAAKIAVDLNRPVLARHRAVEAADTLARLRPRLDTAAAGLDDTGEPDDLADLLARRWSTSDCTDDDDLDTAGAS